MKSDIARLDPLIRGSPKGSSSFFACSQKMPPAPAGGVSLLKKRKGVFILDNLLNYLPRIRI
jgi:hypothetical protein